MADIRLYHGIGNSISTRASLAAEFAKKVAEQQARDTDLKNTMLGLAPAYLRDWIIDEGLLDMLFQYGRYDTKIDFGDQYGFKSLAVTKKMLTELTDKAWRDAVTIKFGRPELHRVQVIFSAIM